MIQYSKVHRFYDPELSEHFNEGDRYVLQEDHFSHVRSLRLKVSDKILCFNGRGLGCFFEIIAFEEKTILLKFLSQYKQKPTSCADLIIADSEPKKLEWVVQKAVELGVGCIWVVDTHRSVDKAKRVWKISKLDRFEKIIIQACMQSGVDFKPSLIVGGTIEALYHKKSSDAFWVCMHPDQTFPHVLERLQNGKKSAQRPVWLIGPEGGWSDQEIVWLKKQSDIALCCLGPTILRMETAAIAALSLSYALS